MDDLQASGAFKIGVNDHDILFTVGMLVQNIGDGLTEDDSVSIDLLCATDVEVRVGARSDGVVDCCDGPVHKRKNVSA